MEQNRIYLDINQHLPARKTKDGLGICRDGSAFPFIIEQFISVAVTDIYMDSRYKEYTDGIPEELKKRICFFDTLNATTRALAVLRPLFEEFEVEPVGHGIAFSCKQDNIAGNEAISSIHTILRTLEYFFCGIEYKLLIDIDVNKMLLAITKLRIECRNGRSRAILAYLNGIFSLYKINNIDSLLLLPPTEVRTISVFNELVEDALYKELSNAIYSTGFPSLSLKTIPKVKRILRELSSKPPFKQLVDISVKTLSIVTSVPIPCASAISDEIASEYLPPITSFNLEIKRGLEYWWLIEPQPMVRSDYFKEMEFEDWQSLKSRTNKADFM